MKKVLNIFLLACIQLTALLLVVGCSVSANYAGLFEPKLVDTNYGDYLIEDYAKTISTFKEAVKEELVIQSQIKPLSQDSNDQKYLVTQSRNIILESIIKRCAIKEETFTLQIYDDNSFTIPRISGFDDNNESISEIEVEYGTAKIALLYLGKIVCVEKIKWSIPEFELLSKTTNILNLNSFQRVGEFQLNKIDLSIFDLDGLGFPMKITFGTIASILSILNLTADNLSSNPLTGMIEPIITPIQKIMKLNVTQLGKNDPNSSYGRIIYEKFDKNFRQYLQEVFLGIKKILTTFNMPDDISIGTNVEGAPKTYAISQLLNANVFEILNLNLGETNVEQIGDQISIYINVQVGSKGKIQELKLIDLLANIAPNLVILFKKFLEPESYDLQQNGTHNILFLVLKELLTDMHQDLLAINNQNNAENKSAYNAKTGLDSLLFNLLIDYNKTRRTKETTNLYIKVKLDVSVPVAGDINIFNDLIASIFNKMNINPGEIVLQIINSLFDLKGAQNLDLNAPFLSPNKGMIFITPPDVNIQAIVNDIDLADWLKPFVTPFFGLITDTIVTNVNSQINAIIPTVSMMDLINDIPQNLLGELDLSDKMLSHCNITIVHAQFVFQFYDPIDDVWNSITKGISAHSFNIYQSLKIKFSGVKFKIEFSTRTNGEFVYYTKNDLSFVIIFADTDNI